MQLFNSIIEPKIAVSNPQRLRPGLAVEPGGTFSRVRWMGRGKVAPPFFLTRMEGGSTEIAALCGSLYEIVLVRFRHRCWISLGQASLRFQAAVNHGLRWDRNSDDFV